MLQQMSPGFVNKKMPLMNKKNAKIPSGKPFCEDELTGILLLSSSCSQKALCSVSFRSGGGGQVFSTFHDHEEPSFRFLKILIKNDVLIVECVMPHSIQSDDVVG